MIQVTLKMMSDFIAKTREALTYKPLSGNPVHNLLLSSDCVPFRTVLILLAVLAVSSSVFATIFGSVRGVIHDSQHRPVQGAMVVLKAKTSDWSKTMTSDANGEFSFNAVPIGEYSATVESSGFAQLARNLVVVSGTEPVVHFQLQVASRTESVTVSATPEVAPTDTATPTTLISRLDIERTPGADRTNSLAMITDYVPGAYITHDQLHIRGGHQVSWLVDGVPVPNTNIAGNIGPQFDPKDIDYLEADRGSYGAEFGDRTYGVFNIAPRTGFERNNEAELINSFGNFYQTNSQINFGSHTDRLAYYASLNGNRGNLGLQPPAPDVAHNAENGYGGFSSLIFNPNLTNQLRMVTSLRKDYYQVPYDPNPNSFGNTQYDSSGLRDGQHEGDAILNVSWVHTFSPKLLLTLSPFLPLQQRELRFQPQRLPGSDHRSSLFKLCGRPGHLRRELAKEQSAGWGLHLLPTRQSASLGNCQRWQPRSQPDSRFSFRRSRSLLRRR